ncbi:thioredoxin-disulfide reductase [Candidatus Kapabacteria bacterium]|nr:thioredoxin-disulfide reductase [Candidatus Kapabacteria bacterium]
MTEHRKIIIIGSGPAGLTAALYSSRANIDTLVLEGQQPGGQLTITTDVENYPGYPNGIMGPAMMEEFKSQAKKFGTETRFETVDKVDFSNKPFKIKSDKKEYTADSVIISTGATAKTLGIESENTYWGSGISACATCDGFFFKGEKNLVVIGGGDTAMEEALFLTKFGDRVTLLNRSSNFKASNIMLQRAREHDRIDIIENVTIDEFLGSEQNGIKKLTGVRTKNTQNGELKEIECGGAFIAIGHKPNTEIFNGIIDMNETGYIHTVGKSTYTNIEGVFACGDAMDWVYRQAVTAAGTGCAAAIDAERWLAEN